MAARDDAGGGTGSARRRSRWPRCLLWHGWLPGLSSRTIGTPWAVASSDLASSCLENAFGSYPLDATSAWQPFWDQDDVQDMIDDVPDNPNICTDGSREPIPHLDIESAGAGAFIHSPTIVFDSNYWGHAQDLDDPHEGSSHIFSGIPGPFSLFRELNIGVSYLLYKPILAFILALTI